MGKKKLKKQSEEHVPLIRPSSSIPDLQTSAKEQQLSKWTSKGLFHPHEPKTAYSSTNSSSERLSDQTGKSTVNYYFNSACSSQNSDNEEEYEHFNKDRYKKMKKEIKNISSISSLEHLNGVKSKEKANGLVHPPYNHQISNRSDLALVQEQPCEGTTSNLQTMMHLLKGNIGTGILAMPNAFGNSGLLTGACLLPIIGSIAVHCMHLLVNNHNQILKRFGTGYMDYEDVAEHAMLCGPKSLRRFSKTFRRIVMGFLLVTQIGFCCAYSIFVAETMEAVLRNLSNGLFDYKVHVYMLVELPVMIAFCLIRDLRTLSIISTVANVLQSIGLVIILTALFDNLPTTWSRTQWAGFDRLPLYFGTVVYAFEGIGIVLPLQKEMKDARSFRGILGVLNTGMVIVGSLYFAIGFFGYLKFGDDVLSYGSITLNLPFTPLNETVKLMFAVALFFTFPLQLYVPINMLWPIIVERFDLERLSDKTNAYELVFRALMTTLTFLIAAAIPKLDLFISLIGALSSSCLALIFPPLIELLVRYDDGKTTPNTWRFVVLKNCLIMSFGILTFFVGTYVSSNRIYLELFSNSTITSK